MDLQINDISFDEAIMRAMAQVVSSSNMRLAAEKDVSEMKGAGNALFREEVPNGLAKAGKVLEAVQVPRWLMLFTMGLDGMKHISEHGKGNVIFFDGSNEGMERTIKQMQAMRTLHEEKQAH